MYQRQNLRLYAFQGSITAYRCVLMSLFVHCTNQNEIRDSSKLHACLPVRVLPISFHNCRVHILALLPSHCTPQCQMNDLSWGHSVPWLPLAGYTLFLLSAGTGLVWETRRQSTFVGLWKMGLLCSATSLKSSFWQRQDRGRHEDRTTENTWGGHRSSGSWHPEGGKQVSNHRHTVDSKDTYKCQYKLKGWRSQEW